MSPLSIEHVATLCVWLSDMEKWENDVSAFCNDKDGLFNRALKNNGGLTVHSCILSVAVDIPKGHKIQAQYRYKYLNLGVEKDNPTLIEKNTYT